MNFAQRLLPVAAYLLLCFCAATAQAQPTSRILVGFPPGGDVDSIARVIAEKLAEAIGRPVVVENRPGASGQIAAMALKAAAPDGNTLMVVPDSSITLHPYTIKTLAYDPRKDFVPVAHLGSYDLGLAVSADVAANDLGDWVKWVKADKRNATFASPSAGTSPHFLGFVLAQSTGVQLVHVPYRGTSQAMAGLLGGQVPAAIFPVEVLMRQVKAGKIRILAQTGGRRASIAPEVPTFKELGYPALEFSGWNGIFAPAGIRPELVARYNQIIIQAQRTPSVRGRMRALGRDIREMTPAEIAAMIKIQSDRWGPIVKASGFSPESQ